MTPFVMGSIIICMLNWNPLEISFVKKTKQNRECIKIFYNDNNIFKHSKNRAKIILNAAITR